RQTGERPAPPLEARPSTRPLIAADAQAIAHISTCLLVHVPNFMRATVDRRQRRAGEGLAAGSLAERAPEGGPALLVPAEVGRLAHAREDRRLRARGDDVVDRE